MNETLLQHWHELLPASAAAVLAVGAGFYWLRPKPEDPIELERERRSYVNRVGRIVEGHILEIIDQQRPQQQSPPRSRLFGGHETGRSINGSLRLLYYTYSISGVTYETAQDISGLQEQVLREKAVAGQSASVKYDPSNPSNSILLADDWSGLH